MNAIVTIIGHDKIGIVHAVTGLMVKYDINIIDITQTILHDYFTMILVVDLKKMNADFDEVKREFENFGNEWGLDIRLQHQKIFDAMHQI